MKTCTKCGKEKPLDLFYRHPKAADGRMSACKECTKSAVRAHRAVNLERIQEYDRQRGQTEKRKSANRERNRRNPRTEYKRQWSREHPGAKAYAVRRFRANNPDKYAAHSAVNYALRSGRLVKQPCEVCANPRTHAHHDDYSKPLEVRWLCASHHSAHHMELRGVA